MSSVSRTEQFYWESSVENKIVTAILETKSFCFFSRNLQDDFPLRSFSLRWPDIRGTVPHLWCHLRRPDPRWAVLVLGRNHNFPSDRLLLGKCPTTVQDLHGAGLLHHALGADRDDVDSVLLDCRLLVPGVNPAARNRC